MPEEEIEQKEDISPEDDYIQVISDLKANSVPKADYQRLKDENKRLLQAYAQGQNLPEEYRKKAEEVDVAALRRDLFAKEHSNLEYVEMALRLRDELIRRGEKDPFLPQGKNYVESKDDVECAERVASVLRECADYADGDSEVFTAELKRRTVDSAPMKRRK